MNTHDKTGGELTALEWVISVMRERLEFGESYNVIDSRAKMLRALAAAAPVPPDMAERVRELEAALRECEEYLRQNAVVCVTEDKP